MEKETHVLAYIAHQMRKNGIDRIPCVRVSSAQAKGAAKKYSYWGVVAYEIVIGRKGLPVLRARGRAQSERRSWSLARRDAAERAVSEGALLVVGGRGRLKGADLSAAILAVAS